jgi:hypothetical protein
MKIKRYKEILENSYNQPFDENDIAEMLNVELLFNFLKSHSRWLDQIEKRWFDELLQCREDIDREEEKLDFIEIKLHETKLNISTILNQIEYSRIIIYNLENYVQSVGISQLNIELVDLLFTELERIENEIHHYKIHQVKVKDNIMSSEPLLFENLKKKIMKKRDEQI